MLNTFTQPKFRYLHWLTFTFFCLLTVQSFGQTACTAVTEGQITTTPVTCPGNGTITVPTITGGFFTVEGGNIVGVLQQEEGENTFQSLNAGTYTVKVWCTGVTEPTSFSIEVENRHSTLQLALIWAMPCANQGTITATASQGFNLGGEGIDYQYAIWSSSEGGANRSDATVTYGTHTTGNAVFTDLAQGTYYVRVRDVNCSNFYTQSVSISPTNPPARVNPSGSWVCSSPDLTYTINGTLRSISNNTTLAPATYPGYKYSVYQLGADDACTEAGTLLIPETNITATSTMQFSLDETVRKIKIITTSPCGEIDVTCHTIPAKPTITVETRVSAICATAGTTSRLALNIYASSGYTLIPSEMSITVSSEDPAFTTIVNGPPLTSSVQRIFELPAAYSPYTVTVTDGCGVSTTREVIIPDPGVGGSAPSILSATYTRSCVDEGNVTVRFYLGGWIFGLEEAPTFELIDVDNPGVVVATAVGLSEILTNSVTFTNIPAGHTYSIRIVPESGSVCTSSQTTTQFIVPAGQGFAMSASASVTNECLTGNSVVSISVTNNGAGTLTYRLEGPDEFLRTTGTSSNVPSGTYSYSATLTASGCDAVVKSGSVTVDSWQVDPKIDKSLSVACQNLGEAPQTVGQAVIQFSGFGPFTVEMKKLSAASFTEVATNVPSTYTFSSLESGVTYQFRVIDQCGKTAVQQVTVKPLNPKIITNSVGACEGESYVLSGVVLNDPTVIYTWTKEGNPTFTPVLAREYTFSSFTADDYGTYKLTVSLFNGCVIRESFLTLSPATCGAPFPLGSLGNYVWYDVNYNGLQDDDTPAEGLSVILQVHVGGDLDVNANWLELDTLATDATGHYLFTDLEGGTYRVKFEAPSGYEFAIYQAEGEDAASQLKNNDSNAAAEGFSGPVTINVNLAADNVGRNNLTVDAGLVAYGSIGDYVWLDSNLDGLQNASPVNNVEVNLYKKNADIWGDKQTATTNTTGNYLFDRLETGTYQVEFVAPDGYEFTYLNEGSDSTKDSDANRTTGKSAEITIAPFSGVAIQKDNLTIDAGLIIEGALPVTLVSFTAVKEGETALLQWKTTEEVNSDRFEIMHSMDAKSWVTIGQVKTGAFNYQFIDAEPSNGINYYRLKMIDRNGSYAYSNIRNLRFEVSSDVALYPNPIATEFYIKSNVRSEISKVDIYDLKGSLILTLTNILPKTPINVKNFSSGTYIVRIKNRNGAIENRKLVIKK